MKVFSCDQIREIDSYTIVNEPIAPIDLMERAAHRLYEWISRYFDRSKRIIIFAGPGNNGGDGLALARLLSDERYITEVCYINFTNKVTDDWKTNRARLEKADKIPFISLDKMDQFPIVGSEDIIVDGIFGSGLKRPVEGLPAEIIRQINKTDCMVVSIDIPSGLFGEDNSGNIPENIIRADYTLSFQFPKLAFFFADNNAYTGEWHILPIGLHSRAIRDITTPYSFTELSGVTPLLKHRGTFDHKGDYGHGLLIAGSESKTGAAVLAAKAALRSGIGLITCHVPQGSRSVLQTSLPEAMVQPDKDQSVISQIDNFNYYSAIGIGPGIGTQAETRNALHDLLKECDRPIVIDADAINILGLNNDLISLIRPGTILTPHPKEFERIAGKSDNGYDRLKNQISFSVRHGCIIILKGAYTSISTPDGRVLFNSTGNPGMATAGSGDVLTGIVLSLLAQGYPAESAAIAAVYLHGLAGDIAAEKSCFESLIASDITENIGNAFNRMRESRTD
jgi:hydroxyethylthiazole kinase-like uncharacterized protein yjeF